ncbi:MAG TPA: DCL family protein [Kiritimatiellia bacterium]|nr:DCL family protein [Kiritimatiellia bacterium]
MKKTRRVSYCFGAYSFTSQAAVKKHAAAIRSRYPVGVTISDAADVAFLMDLINCHAECKTKIGCGISRFYVDNAPDHPGQCFWIERTDHTSTDWGVPSCLIGIGRLNRLSLRMAIKPQMDEFKTKALAQCTETFVSEYSGKKFPVDEAVADHVTEFEDIVQQFFHTQGIDIERELLTMSIDQKSEPVWRDPALLGEFLDYHKKFPLRLVQWRENLSDIKIEEADKSLG